jgi:hypothetical protein
VNGGRKPPLNGGGRFPGTIFEQLMREIVVTHHDDLLRIHQYLTDT